MESNSDFSGARCGEKKRGINLKIKMARFRPTITIIDSD